jgi:phage terminase large subunit-like protein
MTKEDKQQAVEILLHRLNENHTVRALSAIDYRLADYFSDLVKQPDLHNGYEILGAVKFLRLLRTYEFNERKVQQIIHLREGNWEPDEQGRMHYVSGGIRCPGTDVAHVYRWQPFQVFVLASVFGFYHWFDTQVEEGTRDLMITERENPFTNHIEDFRRLCNYFVLYTPRKTDKTGMSAFIQVVFFLLGDYNSEVYCCANAEFQSRILFERTTFMLSAIDNRHRFDITKKQIKWKSQFHSVRNAMIMPLTAGGKTKDGPFAELVNWDELGSSPYTNGKSDMMNLVNVMRSSMGPRREGLTFGTTTAGTITSGPFIDMLQGLHDALLRELKYDTGEETPTLSDDRQLCLLLEPDDWEKHDEELLLTSKDIRRKINPMLGITCQHQFYDDSITDMRNGKMTRGELFSKLFNVYASNTTQEWIKPEEVRAIQGDWTMQNGQPGPHTIDECTEDKGWVVFTGMDFSKGDDLNGSAFLAYNTWTGDYFGDMDVYISEAAANESPIRELLYKWRDAGYITIVPGKTFDPEWPVNRIKQLNEERGVYFGGFGYDPYNAATVINALSQWVFDSGYDPKHIVIPVKQGFGNYSPVVQQFDYFIKRSVDDGAGHQIPQPLIHLSPNSLWPYCFGCVKLMESTDGMGNLKPVKRTQSAACKVDPVQMLLTGLILYNAAESSIKK